MQKLVLKPKSALAVLLALLPLLPGCAEGAPESARAVATRVLAEHTARVANPRGVLVISNPFSQQPGRPPEVYAFEKAGLEGLRKGFGENLPVTVAFPKLKPEVRRDPASVPIDPRTTTPLSFLVAENSFSEVIQQHPKCDLVVSLIGLPVNLSSFQEWSQAGGPRFALLLPDWRMIGGKDHIIRAFHTGKLVAAVVNNPAVPHASGAAGNDYQQAFESRFFLVTRENVEALVREHPAVFGLR